MNRVREEATTAAAMSRMGKRGHCWDEESKRRSRGWRWQGCNYLPYSLDIAKSRRYSCGIVGSAE